MNLSSTAEGTYGLCSSLFADPCGRSNWGSLVSLETDGSKFRNMNFL